MYSPNTKQIKILLIGDKGVGKTALLERFTNNKEPNLKTNKPTVGADFQIKEVNINSENVNIQVWDTAGDPRFKQIGTVFYKGSDSIFLCYDITNEESFLKLDDLLQDPKSGVPDAKVVLVGLKKDWNDHRKVDSNRAQQYANTNNMQYFEVSSKTGENVESLFQSTARAALSAEQEKIAQNNIRQPADTGQQHNPYNNLKYKTLCAVALCAGIAVIAKVAFGYDALKGISNICSKILDKAQEAYRYM